LLALLKLLEKKEKLFLHAACDHDVPVAFSLASLLFSTHCDQTAWKKTALFPMNTFSIRKLFPVTLSFRLCPFSLSNEPIFSFQPIK
jgi:hypothetical protein